MSPVKGWKSTAPAAPPRLSASNATARSLIPSEELLKLHRLAHVTLHLELARHVRRGRVLLAVGDPHERLARGRDRGVGVAAVLADADSPVVNVKGPGAGAVDLEAVGRRQPTRLGQIDPRLKGFEELPRAFGHWPRAYITGSAASRRRARLDGSSAASTRPATGAAAAAYIALRRSIESATAPRPTAATPPSPMERPIASPEAIPIRRGRYSWLITIVTPNVLITQTPTSARATAPRTPPTTTYARISGPVAAMLAISTGRRPKRSAIGPAASVPSPPVSSISESRWLPCAFECPSETSQSGTNVMRPNQATLRKAITPRSRPSAPGRSGSAALAAAASPAGTKPARNGTAASSSVATARHGSASRRPPVRPNA